MATILIVLLIIYLPELLKNKNENIIHNEIPTTTSDDQTINTFELDLPIEDTNSISYSDVEAVNTYEEYLKKHILNKHPVYINNNEKNIIGDIIVSIKNGELNLERNNILFTLPKINNIKKVAAYLTADGLTHFYIISNDEIYFLNFDIHYNENNELVSESRLYKFRSINNVEEIYIAEHDNEDSGIGISGIIIKTKDNEYYSTINEDNNYTTAKQLISLDNAKELELEIKSTFEPNLIRYVSDVNQYIENRKIDSYAEYINQDEKGYIEDSPFSIENKKLIIQNNEILYKINNINNVKKVAAYFEEVGIIWYYILTEDNKVYLLLDTYEDEKYQLELYAYKIDNVMDIIITKYDFNVSTGIGEIIIITKDNRYFIQDGHYKNNLYELISDKTKINNIINIPTIIDKINDKKADDYINVDSPAIRNEDYKRSKINSLDIEVMLYNEELYIYTSKNSYLYNSVKVEQYITTQTENEFSIFFISKEKEAYRIHFTNNEYKSIVKYNIKDVTNIAPNYNEKPGAYISSKKTIYEIGFNDESLYKLTNIQNVSWPEE